MYINAYVHLVFRGLEGPALNSPATEETVEPEEALSILLRFLSLAARTAGASPIVDASQLTGTVVLSNSPETAER